MFKNLCLAASIPLLMCHVAFARNTVDPCSGRNQANVKCLLEKVTLLETEIIGLESKLSSITTTPGPAGPPGAPGAAGTPGAPGAPGAPGTPGVVPVTTDLSLLGDGTAQNKLGLRSFGYNTNWGSSIQGGPAFNQYIGTILLSAGAVVGGLPCDGQTLQIAQNTTLFSLIGTNFGGDGQTTFKLPDLRAQAPNGLTYYIIEFGFYP